MDQIVDILTKPEMWVAGIVSYLIGVVADAIRRRLGKSQVREVLFPAIVANAVVPPLIVASGHAVATGNFAYDVLATSLISATYVGATALSSTVHRGFALVAPNAAILAIGLATREGHMTTEQIQSGLMTLYPLVYALLAVVVLATSVRPTFRTVSGARRSGVRAALAKFAR